MNERMALEEAAGTVPVPVTVVPVPVTVLVLVKVLRAETKAVHSLGQ